MEYSAIIHGKVPSKSNSYKVIKVDGQSRIGKKDVVKRYEEAFMWQVGKIRDAGISGMFEFYLDVYYPTKSPDLDGCFKVVLDLLQKAKVIKNDNNCCKIVARKFIDKTDPRVEFKIITID